MGQGGRRIGAVVVGLLLGLIYLVWLAKLGIVEPGIVWLAEPKGMIWVPVVLIAVPTVMVLLSDAKENLVFIIPLVLILAGPLIPYWFSEDRERAAAAAKQQKQMARWEEEAAAAVRQATGAPEVEAGSPARFPVCDKIVVWARWPKEGTWYWYDASTGRITGSVTQARLAELITSQLRSGYRAGTPWAMSGNPSAVHFYISNPDDRSEGSASIGSNCQFMLTSVTFKKPFSFESERHEPMLDL